MKELLSYFIIVILENITEVLLFFKIMLVYFIEKFSKNYFIV
jgi:hypothetical protein